MEQLMESGFFPRKGLSPEQDAWVKNFFTENHIAYETFPDLVASPEQLNFMVRLEPEQLYYPCSDKLFEAIIEKKADTLLTTAYAKIWTRLERLVSEVINDDYKKKYLLSLLSIKFNHEITHKVQLPGHLEKRLLGIFTTISEIDRPLASVREEENKRAWEFLQSEPFHKAYLSPEGLRLTDTTTIPDIDLQLHLLKLRRLLLLTTCRSIWGNDGLPNQHVLNEGINCPIENEAWLWLCEWVNGVVQGHKKPCILWLAGRSGEIVLDLAIISNLMEIGVRVILAVKQNFYYHRISYADIMEDPVLVSLLQGAALIDNSQISKNDLLRLLDNDNRLLVISDGTGEDFNPLLTSVTFARAFKEADLVISRSPGCREIITNRFQFTRDILSLFPENEGKIDMLLKPHHPATIRFPQSALRKKADVLIKMAREERERGKKIMFYSAIVGSIPGELQTAKHILSVFVEHLRATLHDVVIINPAEHFEEGMDADDIMYMWEIFQRSGMIDIWRFQSVDDIEYAFSLMKQKVPPEWSGKDATYSTGCTKEMEIAIEVQRTCPEMQLIGPPWEKFKRRSEYGVGKLYDRTLTGY
ncbi:MAG: hypothetical protein CSA32_03815 [Desulfobulbus propionicus]|nr:MAG: hypothetical protein CSA32_03815 [Desulfobulbus propionicus]